MKVGLFDSGIGGLTVLKTLLEKYPNNDYIYLGDTLNLPYGNKTKKELLELSKKNIDFLISKRVDQIVIACGTVSSNCIEDLKKEYSIPIYSIITPTIEYLNKEKFQNIAIIATNATINSHIFKNNINKNIYEINTPLLVPLIENNNLEKINIILNNYLKDYLNKIDILVLGCTHYPIIKENIKHILNNNTYVLDVSSLIELSNFGNKTLEIYFTKLNNNIINNTKKILNKQNINIQKINL